MRRGDCRRPSPPIIYKTAWQILVPLAAHTLQKIKIARQHNRAVRVNRRQIRALKVLHEIRLGGLLQRRERVVLKVQVVLVVLPDFAHQPLERARVNGERRARLLGANLANRQPLRALKEKAGDKKDIKASSKSRGWSKTF